MRRFVSDKYGFSMDVPPGWSPSIELDTPVYFYAPFRGEFGQYNFPQGGAIITVTAHDTESGKSRLADSPPKWAVADAEASASTNPVAIPFEVPAGSHASDGVMTSYDEMVFSREQQKHHTVAVFWKFNGQLFEAKLSYVSGD